VRVEHVRATDFRCYDRIDIALGKDKSPFGALGALLGPSVVDQVVDAADGAIEYVCIDVANGYHENFVAFVRRIRTRYPRLECTSFNVSA